MQLPTTLQELHTSLGIPTSYGSQLTFFEQPDHLISIGEDMFGRPQRLCQSAASAWHKMQNQALLDGIALQLVSAFRDYHYQAEVIKRKLSKGIQIEEILSCVAAPGFSEHHSGRAIDLSTPNSQALEEEFEHTDAFKWLKQHAEEFNFYLSYPKGNREGFIYEPWHWCYRSNA